MKTVLCVELSTQIHSSHLWGGRAHDWLGFWAPKIDSSGAGELEKTGFWGDLGVCSSSRATIPAARCEAVTERRAGGCKDRKRTVPTVLTPPPAPGEGCWHMPEGSAVLTFIIILMYHL